MWCDRSLESDESIHYMQLPREVIVGVNILDRVGEICTKQGFHGTALVVSGPVTYPIAGVGVAKSAAKAGLHVDHIIVKESTEAVLNQIIETIKKTRPSIVLAVGGGKDIDLGKLASAKASIPFMSIPTAASHDGIASPYASIKGGPKPYSIRAQAPIAIIGDIGVIADSPYDLLAAGCGDIVAKFSAVKDWQLAHKLKNEYYGDYAAELALMSAELVTRNSKEIIERSKEGVRTVVEALISCGVAMSIAGSSRPCSGAEHLFSHALDIVAKFSAVKDWQLAHKLKNEYYGDYAAELALMSAELVTRNSKEIIDRSKEGVRTVVEALISCGVAMSIAGSSRPCSGAEHLFSHALDIVAGETSLHGGRTGVGAIMCAYLHGSNWESIREFLQEIGAPSTAKELRVSPEQVVKALTMAHSLRPERYTILGETGVTEGAADKVARATGVIG